METVVRQTKSIRLETSDWLALSELAKAHNRSVNNFLETLVKAAIARSRESSPSSLAHSKKEYEGEVLQALSDVNSGKVAFIGTVDELRKRYEGI